MRPRPVAILGAALLLLPRPAAACSMFAEWWSPFAGPGHVGFVGTATPDTMRAGRGGYWYRSWLPFGGRSIHGQVVRVERLSPSADPALAEAVRRSGGRIVVVPWAYSTTCRRMRWERSARWLAPDTRGLFGASLRDRAHWADGVPTVDLRPVNPAYHGIPYSVPST